MSAHVLLNSLNKLGEEIKCLPNILSYFRNEFNKFNNTGARMLDCIYHMTLNSFEIAFFARKIKLIFAIHVYTRRYSGRQYITSQKSLCK